MKKFQALLIAVAFMGSVAAQAQHDHAAGSAAAPATTESTQTTQTTQETTTEVKKSPKAAAAEKKCAKMKDEAKKAECMSKAAAM